MKVKINFIFITFILFTLSLKLYGAGDAGMISTGISEGAKAISMGESFTGYSNDVYAQFWNPAAVYGKNAISFTHINIFDEIYSEFAIFSFPSKIGNIGFYMHYVSYGEFSGLDEHARNPYNFTASDYDANLNYAGRIKNNLHLGVSIKYAHSSIDSASANLLAMSLGGMYYLRHGLTLGLSLRNIGTKATFYNTGYGLPWILSLGASKKMGNLLYTGNIDVRNDDKPQLGLGVEYNIKFFYLRCGLKTEKDLGVLSLFRFGVGVRKHPIEFDYAAIPSGDLGFQQILSLSVVF